MCLLVTNDYVPSPHVCFYWTPFYSIQVVRQVETEQEYLSNTLMKRLQQAVHEKVELETLLTRSRSVSAATSRSNSSTARTSRSSSFISYDRTYLSNPYLLPESSPSPRSRKTPTQEILHKDPYYYLHTKPLASQARYAQTSPSPMRSVPPMAPPQNLVSRVGNL
jgi:hypothetical protein